MATINRVPRGLLGLFDAKTMGKTPAEIDTRVSIGVEAVQMYLSDVPLQIATAQTVPLSVPLARGGTITVPDGELWFVQHIQWFATVVAGPSDVFGYVDVGPVAAGVNDVAVMPITGHEDVPFGAGFGSGDTYSPNLIYGPGSVFGTLISEVTGTLSVQTRVGYRSLQV